MSDNKPTLKLFIGQINLNHSPLRKEDRRAAAFLIGLNKIPLLLADSFAGEEYYTFLGALDSRNQKYRDALFQSLQKEGLYTDRDEFEDHLARGVLDWDGVMVIPRYLVETIAETGTSKFEEMMAQAERAAMDHRQEYLDTLGDLLQKHDILSLGQLGRLLESLSPDYIRRMIPTYRSPTHRLRSGGALWVTDGNTAEMVRGNNFPYQKTLPQKEDILKSTLDMWGEGYELADISPLLIRQSPDYYIAVLKSQSHTVYVNNDYLHLDYPLQAYIRGELEPVFVRSGDQTVKIIMPVRMRKDKINADSPEYRALLGQISMWGAVPDCRMAQRQQDGQCLGYQRSEADDEPVDACKRCPRHTSFDPDECVDGDVE